jgi:hypothetical protein
MTPLTTRVSAVKAECQRVLELADAAMDGPWEVDDPGKGLQCGIVQPRDTPNCDHVLLPRGSYLERKDANFIAASRTALPAAARTTLAAFAVIEAGTHTFRCEYQNGRSDECTCWLSGALTALCDAWEGKENA